MKKIGNMILVLQELQKAFDRKVDANDFLDQKLQNVLNYSSVIFTVASVIIASALLDKIGILYWVGLFFVFLLYIITFLTIKKGQTPTTFHNPISNDLDELKKLCIDVKEEKAIDTLIRAHLSSMYEAGLINDRKDKAFGIASNLMFWMVSLLFISILLGLIFSALKFSDFINPVINFFLRIIKVLKP
jgi:hypothetical protein